MSTIKRGQVNASICRAGTVVCFGLVRGYHQPESIGQALSLKC
jgi:hypothetical protein